MEWGCLHPCTIISNTLHHARYVTLSLQQPPVPWKRNKVRPPNPTCGFSFSNLFEGHITVTAEEHPNWMLQLRKKPQISPTTSHSLRISNETSRPKLRSKAESLWRSCCLGALSWTSSGRCLAPKARSQRASEQWRQKGHCDGCASRGSCHCRLRSNTRQFPSPSSRGEHFYTSSSPTVSFDTAFTSTDLRVEEREGRWEDNSLRNACFLRSHPYFPAPHAWIKIGKRPR